MKKQLSFLVLFLITHLISFANDLNHEYITVAVRNARISLNVKDQPLKNVFVLIEQKTGLSVNYNASSVNGMETVNYKADDVTLATVFQVLLKNYQGSVKQVDENHIFLKLEKRKTIEKAVAPIIAAAAATSITITGTVTDENNQPVPGVSIHEKISKKNTTTDANGRYSITVNTGDVLVYNFIGYAPQEVTVGDKALMNVQLKVQNSQLKEIVAIGYQSVRKSDVTGAISSVKASELNLTSPSVGQALVGKVAGVQISQVSGAPYASTKIRVRGVGSINASSDPLYVVDGFPMDNDVFINPEDIESIDILKDAASAAIYGSRAAGGVVLITTKRGKEGKGKFQYDLQTGINQLGKKVKLLNSEEFAQLMIDGRNNSYHDFVVNGGKEWNDAMYSDDNATRIAKVGNANAVSVDPKFYDFANQKVIKPQYNTDWQDLLYRNAMFSRHNLSFSGGSKEVKYYISGGYQNQDGIILNTGLKKINFRANVDGQINPKLKAGMNVSYTNNQNRETEEGRWDHNPIMAALLMLPTYRAFDDNGNIVKNEVAALSSTYGYNSFENPLAIAKEINIRRNGNRATYNGYAVYQVLPELSLKANLGMSSYAEKYDYYYPTSLSSGVSAPYSDAAKAAANARAKNTNKLDQLGEFTAAYSKQFNKHKLDVLGGYTVQKTTGDILEIRAEGFQDDRIQEVSAKGADAALFKLTTASKYVYTLVSYLGRINYNYDNRYYLTASFRTDASSRFGPQNRWGSFPSVAAGWNISNESFYHDWLGQHSTLKLRASWGLSGNNNIGNYNSATVMGTPTGVPFGNGTINTGTFANGIKDPKIGWESTSQYNAGLDLGLLNGRLNVIANYYVSYSYNLLFDRPVSAISGATTVTTNLRDSKIRNRGIDLQIDGRVIQSKEFNLNLTGNISVNRNKVLDMGGANTIFKAGAERSYLTHIIQTGQPVGMFYGFRVLGVATEANYKTVAPSASSTNPMHPGDLYFYDKNGDGVVNDADKDVIGSPYPKFTYGFNLSATYKDFYFSSSFNGSYGNQVLDGQDYYLYNMEGSGNQYADVAQRFRSNAQPGAGSVYRASRAGTQSNSTRLSTFYLQDGSYFRCTNIMLGYNFRFRALQQKLGVSKASLFASVDNAFTITKYKGYNPEVDYGNGSNIAPGVDYGMYPLVRAYNAGVKLAF